ncbi:MAG TPA: tetratricopeptide repeat protein, partial [Vicinamibacteria bacterium]|nr:tetratricopeptide repeat protein [Vicinamibacteria bacterium]
MTRIASIVLAGLGLLGAPASASLEDAEAAVREGRYGEADEIFARESVANPTPRLYRRWVESLRLTGRIDEGLARIAAFVEKEPASVELENKRGELLYARGRVEEARAAFERAIEGRASDHLVAELNLAMLLFDEGKLDEALARFDRFIDVYNGSAQLSSEELVAVGIACRYLGATNPDLYKDALRVLDEAKAKDPSSHQPTIRAGELFLEKY